MAGYYGFASVFVCTSDLLSVRPSAVRPSVHSYDVSGRHLDPDDRFLQVALDFHQTLYVIDIVEIWFETAIGKVRHFLTELSTRDTSIVSFPDDYLSTYQWINTKLGMCIDIIRSGLDLLMGKFREI